MQRNVLTWVICVYNIVYSELQTKSTETFNNDVCVIMNQRVQYVPFWTINRCNAPFLADTPVVSYRIFTSMETNTSRCSERLRLTLTRFDGIWRFFRWGVNTARS